MAVTQIIIPTTTKDGKILYDEGKLKKILNQIELFQLMSKFSNVVDFYGFGLYDDHLYICVEQIDLTLWDVIRLMHIAHNDFSNEIFGYTTISIIEALIEFKKVGVTHGDIRPINILIKRSGEIKLSLLGYSSIFHRNIYSDSSEKIRGQEYDERADIWSLGITLLEFILGYNPLDHDLSNFSWEEIEKKEEFQNYFNDYYRENIVKSFLKKCLEVDVQNRPNLMQIQELAFYKTFAPTNLDKRRLEIALSIKKYEKFYEDLVSDVKINKLQYPDSHYDSQYINFDIKDCEVKSEVWNHVIYLHKPSERPLALRSYFTEIIRNYDEIVPKMKSEISFFRELNHCTYIMKFYGLCMHNLKSYLIFEPMDLSLREFYLYYWLIQDANLNKKELAFPVQYLGNISISVINALSEIHSKVYQMDLNLESTKIYLNIKGQVKIGSSATRKIDKVSDSGEKFDLILLHEILMESGKNNYLEFGLTYKDQLKTIIIDRLEKDTILAEVVQKNLLVCKDLNDMLTSDFVNNMNKHSLNSLKETNFYKQNIDNFSENEELMAKSVKSLSNFSNSSEIKAIVREWLIEDAKKITLRSSQLKQDFEHEQQILATPLYSMTTPRLVFPLHTSEYIFNILDFDDEGEISRNRFSVVNKSRHKRSGVVVAIKSIPLPAAASGNITEVQIKDLKNEVELLKALTNSPNITTFYGSFICDNKLYICMEFMEMPLTKYYQQVHQMKSSFPEELLGSICICVIDALIACKNIQIMHRDVKPLNILLNRTGEIKLCDFGVSRILQDSLATTVIGTMAYWPPERFTGVGSFDIRHDVWSLGITLIETALGNYPLSKNSSFDASFSEVQNNIKNLRPDKFDSQLSHYSNDTMEFIHLCLQSIDNRPKYDGLTNTNFYQIYSQKKAPLDVAKIMNSIDEPIYPNFKKEIRENSYFKTNVIKFPNDTEEYTFDINDLQELATLYSIRHIVKKYLHKPSNHVVAVKFLPFSSNGRILEQIIREINMHKFASSSSYVVDFYGLCFHETQALIVMEYMEMSLKTLYTELHKGHGHFSEDLLGLISVALLNCLAECNKLGIMHRDIKLHNILINKSGEVKLCDFGESRIATDFASTNVGTYAYWGPERYQFTQNYNEKSEIWSLGMTLAELSLGRYPFEDELSSLETCVPDFLHIQHIIHTVDPIDIVMKIERQIGSRSDFCQFLEYCLQRDFNERWSATDLMETTWYKKYNRADAAILFHNISDCLSLVEIELPSSQCSSSLTSLDPDTETGLISRGTKRSCFSKFLKKYIPLIMFFIVVLIYIFLYFYFSLIYN